MDAPARREELVDVGGLKKVWRAVRAVKHGDVPGVRERRNDARGQRPDAAGVTKALAPRWKTAACDEASAAVAAEEPERGRLRRGASRGRSARWRRRAAARYSSALRRDRHGAEAQLGAGRDLEGGEARRRRAIHRRVHVGARERDDRRGVKAQRGPDEGALEPGGAGAVADEAVGETERQRVHGTGRRNAHIPVAEAARDILDGRLRAALEHLRRERRVGQRRQQRRVDVAGDELRRREHVEQVGAVALDACDARVLQGRHETRARLFARRAARDELGEQGVVIWRHLAAAHDGRFDAHAVREGDVRQHAAARLKRALRILGVEAGLNGGASGAGWARRELGQRGQLAGREAHHPFDEVDPRDLFGDAVLDLDARVHLEEGVHVAPASVRRGGVEHELDGARRAIARAASEPDRRLGQAGARRVRQPRRGRLLDHLLVTPLQRAVALAEAASTGTSSPSPKSWTSTWRARARRGFSR